MATTEDTTYNYFYWYIDNLFKRCQHDIIYQAQNIRDGHGNSLIDRYVMTNKEENIFMKLLKSSAGEVHKLLLPVSSTITSGFKFNESLQDTVEDLLDAYGIAYFTILPDNYPADHVESLDSDLEEAIICGVLWRWWDLKKLIDYREDEKNKCEELFLKIKSNINRRTEPITSSRAHKML